jgi:single-strand DNA-binding protein
MSTKVTLVGRLTRDPDLKYSAAGKPFTLFAIVTSRRVKDATTGEWSDKDTTFWDCVAFGQLAENITESLAKGTAVIATGSAASEEWTGKDGQARRSMKVTVDEIAPSLRWASAKVLRAERATGAGAAQDSRWGGDEPPF